MKRLGIGIIFFAGLCIGCVDSKRTDRESVDFFGVDLNKANQIEVLHNELLRGKVKYREKTLTEWTDGLISDYDMSDGKVTSMTISEGAMSEIEPTYHSLDSIFSHRFSIGEHYKQNDWIFSEEGYYTEYLNFYDYNAYRISLSIRLYSPTKDENEVSSGLVRVGLGEKIIQGQD